MGGPILSDARQGKLEVFKKEIVPYLEDKSLGKDRDWFNLAIAQRWIFKKVLDLGWTEDRFATFDSSVDGSTTHPRGEYKAERIGKKYQWMAFHEFLARVSDNFEFAEEMWSGASNNIKDLGSSIDAILIHPASCSRPAKNRGAASRIRGGFP